MLKQLCDVVRRFSPKPAGVPAGLYHYIRPCDGATARFHLRVDAAGDGLLLVNAAALARLSPSGVVIAKGLLDGEEPSQVVHRCSTMFRGATDEKITTDVAMVAALIHRLEPQVGSYPIRNLSDPAFSPKHTPLGRPISADVTLCPPFHMRQILDRLWQLAIPHVTVVVGRDPDKAAMVRAVEHASDLGMICGVRGRGTDLGRDTRVADMVAAGLDHLDVYCLSDQDDTHDALAGPGDSKQAARTLAAARKYDVCAVAQLALVRPTLATLEPTLNALVRHGVKDAAVFAIATADAAEAHDGALLAHELVPAARLVEELAERLGMRLLWFPTVRFDPAQPLGEQVCRGPRTSGDTAIRVEPDGSVLVARGPFRPVGNLIDDEWSVIEQSDVYQRYRRRVEGDTHCDQCPGLAICAADCPRDSAGWAESVPQSGVNHSV